MKKYLCLLVALAVVAGCQKAPASKPSTARTDAATPPAAGPVRPPDAAAARPKPVPAQLPEVVARVNGSPITRAEFERALREFEGRSGGATPANQRDEVYRGVLADMVAFRLLSGELQTRSVALPTGQLDQAMSELRGQFPTNEAFKQALAAQGITAEELREKTRTNLLINRLLEQEVGADTPVKPADVAAFYEKNPARFTQPESVRVSHILIGVRPGAPEPARQAALSKAREMLAKARSGADFAALARRYSQDASRERGGDLGYVPRGQATPPFEQAAFALAPGAISEIVETPFGYHVIKLADRRPSRTVPFGEAAAQIESYLLEQRRQDKARTYIDRLKTSNKVEILI